MEVCKCRKESASKLRIVSKDSFNLVLWTNVADKEDVTCLLKFQPNIRSIFEKFEIKSMFKHNFYHKLT